MRRREQIGPVNPLAKREYEEASEHVKDLSAQRKDMEAALAELEGLISRTDRRSARLRADLRGDCQQLRGDRGELFPGGRGRLRRIAARARGPSRWCRTQTQDAAEGERRPRATPTNRRPQRRRPGVEIEVTPAGQVDPRLSLLSGGEKSLVALAFVFAVLMARPCPFYILDEVEAALDDINIDRFLRLVRRFSERSQFIVVTHQKRTMDAADILYGVSMGGDGITKVVSRKLPRDGELQPATSPRLTPPPPEA